MVETAVALPAAPVKPAYEVVEVHLKAAPDFKVYAYQTVLANNWSTQDMLCLEHLWTKESHWNPKATNKSSGAHGIPQALPASKMASAGEDYITSAKTQIDWGIKYIKTRYSTPCRAWATWQKRGWY